jgi:hypothetical protein
VFTWILVILADGGGQRFNHPQIQENVLPVWFGIPRPTTPRYGKSMAYRRCSDAIDRCS